MTLLFYFFYQNMEGLEFMDIILLTGSAECGKTMLND